METLFKRRLTALLFYKNYLVDMYNFGITDIPAFRLLDDISWIIKARVGSLMS